MSCKRRKSGGLKVLFFGMLVGLVLGLMFAPRPGAELIGKLRG